MQQYFARLKQRKRETKSDKRTAARHVLVDPLLRYGIQTDAGRTFPGVLSYGEWTAIRDAESRREASRVELRERKEQNRATYGVARGGRPLPDIDPTIVRALQPFVEACTSAHSQLRQRAEEAMLQKTERRAKMPVNVEHRQMATTPETLARATPPMQEEA